VAFSRAEFEAVVAEISAGLEDFAGKLDRILPVATAAMNRWYIPDDVRQAGLWIATKTVEVGRYLLNLFIDVVKGTVAPVVMFYDAWQWMDVRGAATGMSAALSEQHLAVDNSDWSGQARDAYVKVVAAQSQAAARIGSIASSTSVHLLACAAAGAAFYVALAVVLAKLIAAAAACIAAYASAVFSWAGAALMIEEAGFTTASITAAVTTLTAFLGAQATSMVNLHGEAVDSTSFPGGRWPRANTGEYNDATVKDGDADWSLAGS
jgi:hypothetical protein